MNGNERSVQKMNGIERTELNGNERDAQPCNKSWFHFTAAGLTIISLNLLGWAPNSTWYENQLTKRWYADQYGM